ERERARKGTGIVVDDQIDPLDGLRAGRRHCQRYESGVVRPRRRFEIEHVRAIFDRAIREDRLLELLPSLGALSLVVRRRRLREARAARKRDDQERQDAFHSHSSSLKAWVTL